jgi:hypothetical protein
MVMRGGHLFDLGARLVLLSLVLAAPMRASASSPGHLLFSDERPTFRAGDVVNLQWTPLPPEAEEFELLLSLDGGRRFVRLTEMQGPGARTLEWRVPNLPSDDARLRLRMGRMGEEIELELSAPFTIVGREDRPVACVSFREGEWWTSQAVSVVPPDAQNPGQRTESPAPRDWAAHLAPSLARDFVVTGPPLSALTARSTRADSFPSDRPPPRGQFPRVIPLRE